MSEMRGLMLAIELATKHRDVCQGQVALAQRNVYQDKDQLSQLQSYAMDKDTRWIEGGLTNFSAEIVKHHYQFMDRLQQAMFQQSGVIRNSEAVAKNMTATLLEAEIRLAGLNEILQRRLRDRESLNRKREQKQADEFASQQYARRRIEYEQGEVL